MQRVAIVGMARTPIGKFGGQLASKSAVELGTIAIEAALSRARVAKEQVDEVYMGMAVQAGQGQNPARQAARNAGLADATPAVTINVLCGSGMEAVSMAAKQIRLGDAEVMVAGGMESMSNAPYLLPKARGGYRFGDGQLVDGLVKDGLTDAFYGYPMGITAENLLEQAPIERERIDAFALRSHQKARAAQQDGRFTDEIVPVTVTTKQGPVEVTADEGVRDTSMAALAKLKPAFKADGQVTAGNAASLNDGAAALVLMAEDAAKAAGAPILGYWVDGNLTGVDPQIMGIGPLYASQKLLKKHQLAVSDLDLVELNEAFASQALLTIDRLGLDEAKVNVNGGALALGHPLGDSGARIIITLLAEMNRRHAHRGLATLCIGGGMGAATIIEGAN